MKTLLIVDQHEDIKAEIDGIKRIYDESEKKIKKLKKQIDQIEKEDELKKKVFWDNIDLILEKKGLIQKDEDGDYPALTYNHTNGVLIELSHEDVVNKKMQEVLQHLKKSL